MFFFFLNYYYYYFQGLVTLDQMRAKQEDLVREHEKQLAAKLKSDETERFVQMQFMYFHHLL